MTVKANNEQINLQYTTIINPLPCFIYDGLKKYSRNANLYYSQPSELIKKLAQKFKLSPEMIFLAAGTDEAIQMFALTYGESTYIFSPTYKGYSYVEKIGGKLSCLNSIRGTDYVVSTDKISDATIIFLANPNNPFGFTIKYKIMELVNNNRHAMVIIDEAYAEFANLSVIDEVKNYPNMVVLRSFSKSYGMAGNRVGFIVASPKVISKIRSKAQFSNVSYLSVGAAVTALKHENYFAKIIKDINQRRKEFIDFLKKQNYTVFPSKINAVLLKFNSEKKATKFVNYLNQKNIIVNLGNGVTNIGLDNSFVRIAIGTQYQIKKLKKVIKPRIIKGGK